MPCTSPKIMTSFKTGEIKIVREDKKKYMLIKNTKNHFKIIIRIDLFYIFVFISSIKHNFILFIS